jgi:hypothetical protein
MIKARALGNAVATEVAVGYALFRLMAALAPRFLFDVGQSWFHTLDVEPIQATGSMSTAMFVLGLVSCVVVSRLGAYATGELYGRGQWPGPGSVVTGAVPMCLFSALTTGGRSSIEWLPELARSVADPVRLV